MAISPSSRNRLILLALWAVFYASFTLFVPPLLDDADSVHAEVAREMLVRHDWITLYANGIRYLEKAPMLYWSMAASFKLFGVSTAAARIPLALTVLALCLILERFARMAFGTPRAGLYAGLITLSSFGVFIFTRITIPDADVCLWLTLALLAFWQTEQAPAPVLTPAEPDRSTSIHPQIKLPSPDRTVAQRKERRSSKVFKILPYPRPSLPPEDPNAPPLEALPAGFDFEHWDRSDTRALPGQQLDLANLQSLPAPRQQAPRTPCYLFAAACALNVLTKGLIGIVFPIAIVLLYLLITRGPAGTFRRLRELHPVTSFLVFLALAAPWHILIGLANPTQGSPLPITHLSGHWIVPLPTDGNVHGWFWFYFVNEHLLRYLNLRVPRDYDTVPLVLFWGLILIWLAPWSAWIIQAVRRIPLRRAVTQLEKTNLLLGLWAATPLLFFSLSTRQEYYVLPALPALILLIAATLSRDVALNQHGTLEAVHLSNEGAALIAEGINLPRHGAPAPKSHTRFPLSFFALTTLLTAAILFFLFHIKAPLHPADLATLLQQNPGDYALSFGHFLDLNAQALGLFRLPLVLTAFTLFFGGLANWQLRRSSRPHAANLALAAATFLFLLAAHLGLQTFAPILSSEQLVRAIAPQLHPEDLIVLHGEYESGSTLGFYLRRNDLHILEGRSSNLWYGSFFSDAPPIFETRDSIAQKWPGPQRIFLWQDPSDKERPVLTLTPTYLIAKSGGKQILSNQPNR